MNETELKAIEGRAAKATPGPWDENGVYNVLKAWDRNVMEEATGFPFDRHDDAPFIAHAREDVPALCAEVRRLRAMPEKSPELADEYGVNHLPDCCLHGEEYGKPCTKKQVARLQEGGMRLGGGKMNLEERLRQIQQRRGGGRGIYDDDAEWLIAQVRKEREARVDALMKTVQMGKRPDGSRDADNIYFLTREQARAQIEKEDYE